MTIKKELKNLCMGLYGAMRVLRYGNITAEEKKEMHKLIQCYFKELDENKISYRIQNDIMYQAQIKENQDKYFIDVMKSINIEFI